MKNNVYKLLLRNIKYIIFSGIFFIFSVRIQARNISADELKVKLDKAAEPDKALISYQLAFLFFETNDKQYEVYANQAINFAKKNSLPELSIKSNHLLAEYYLKNSDFKNSKKYYENEYELLKKSDKKKEIALVLLNLGRVNNKTDNKKK